MNNIIGNVLSGLVGAIFATAVTLLTLRFHYHDLYAKSISSNRMDWINNFREEISTIIACLSFNDLGERAKYAYDAEKARAKLLTRLNMDTTRLGNEYNEAMDTVLNSICFECGCTSQETVKRLITLSRKILEPEWQRVKEEARGRHR